MDICLRDNLILFRCFAKTSKVNLQLPIILKNQLFRHASSYHVHVGHINFQQTRVSRSVQTMHTKLFAKRRKLDKFATTNSNSEKKTILLDMLHHKTDMYINFQQNRVNRSVITVHTNVFGSFRVKSPKKMKFETVPPPPDFDENLHIWSIWSEKKICQIIAHLLKYFPRYGPLKFC